MITEIEKGIDTMKTLFIICAMFIAGEIAARFTLSIMRKEPLWTIAIVSGLQMVALGFMFRFMELWG